MVYAHSVDFFVLMFPCIQNLFIEWMKSNTVIFFQILTLFLSKFQRQFNLTLATGFFFSKGVIISNKYENSHKYEKQLLQIYFIGITFF